MHRVTFAEPGAAPVENLYGRIGDREPHLVFAGHTDVVPPGDDAEMDPSALCGRDRRRHPLWPRRGRHEGRNCLRDCGHPRSSRRRHAASHKGSISFLITGDEEGVAVNGTVKLLQWA